MRRRPAPARRAALVLLASPSLLSACGSEGGGHQLAILDGLVIDPETGLFDRRNVGIRGRSVVTVTSEPIEAARVIDATGLVVVPGFVDLHRHAQDEDSYDLMVLDGVTTALELEVGTSDVGAWYADREGGQRVHYGVSVGHVPARMEVLGDPGTGLLPAGVGGSAPASSRQLDAIEGLLRRGLDLGAVAVGFGSAYTPGADMAELSRMFDVAAEYGAPVHVHVRGGLAGLDSTLEAAHRTRAPLHVVHINASAGGEIEAFLAHLDSARSAGLDVTTEAYPYGAGPTEIQSALFDDWEAWSDDRFGQLQLVSTGQRLDRAGFARARAGGGTVIIHDRTEEMTRRALESPLTIVASDGALDHPRGAGTYARVLGRFVRDEPILSLGEAVRKMTIAPALRLQGRVPAMARKGRIQVGADADIAIFDPLEIADRATYEEPTLPSAGMRYVVVAGRLVVDDGALTDARPGLAVRAPIR